MGACISGDDVDDEDIKRWENKKKTTKGACVPKVGQDPLAATASPSSPTLTVSVLLWLLGIPHRTILRVAALA